MELKNEVQEGLDKARHFVVEGERVLTSVFMSLRHYGGVHVRKMKEYGLELLIKWKFSWERWNTARHILVARKKGQELLVKAQNSDGGWGSVVETSLSISGLWRYTKVVPKGILDKGIRNLLTAQNGNG